MANKIISCRLETEKTFLVSVFSDSKHTNKLKLCSMDTEALNKERIMAKSEELFAQFGFNRVTMNEIAGALGMSKKTLYKYFNNKEDIVKEIFSKIKCDCIEFVDELYSNPDIDFLQKLKTLLNFLGIMTSRLKGPLVTELESAYPAIYKEMKEFQRQRALDKFSHLIHEGVKQGVFRDDIQTDIVVHIYLSAVRELIDPSFLSSSSVSAEQVYENITTILFEGIMNDSSKSAFNSLQDLPKHKKLISDDK